MATQLDRAGAAAGSSALAARRLHTAGLTPPIPLLLLHGWSPGPGLPGSLLTSGLFTPADPEAYSLEQVHEIEASTIITIATNRYAIALAVLLVSTAMLIARVGVWYVWLTLIPALLGGWKLKKLAVGFTIDSNLAEATRAIARFRPAAVVGYSWGGAIVECCIATGVWSGPTLLLAPCGALLTAHAGRKAPTLSRLRPSTLAHSDQVAPSTPVAVAAAPTRMGESEDQLDAERPTVTLFHGDADGIVPVHDSFALAQSAAPGVCKLVVGRDDHFLWRLCNADTLLDVLTSMISDSNGSQMSRG